MFLRDAPTETVQSLLEQLDDTGESLAVRTDQIQVTLTGESPSIRFEGKDIEVPVTEQGIAALGNWVEIPSKFLGRIPHALAEHLLRGLLEARSSDVLVRFADTGIRDLYDPHQLRVDPRRMVEIASRVVSPEALVVEWYKSLDFFTFDVIVPADFERGVGGDPQVGDITRGGVRFGVDHKHHYAPWVRPYLYRLICTNGAEVPDVTLDMDARGATFEEVMAELEAMAEIAFSRVERDIERHYALRAEKVDNAERTLMRMGEETKLPERTIYALLEAAPALIEGEEATMFDLVNSISNLANDPHIRNRRNSRRALELSAGYHLSTHADRCGRCQTRLRG